MLTTTIGQTLVLILTEDNLRRMAAGDPVTHMVKPLMPNGPDIEIVIGSVADDFQAKDGGELLQHIFRGYQRTPEDGHDPIPVMSGKDKA